MHHHWLELALEFVGTAAFAVTAVLAVTPRGIDIFGIAVIAVITAIGGGTIRDLILGVPVFWSSDLSYIWVALAAGMIVFVAQRQFTRSMIHRLMLHLDGVGAALFSVHATHKVWDLGFGLPLAPVMLGIVTGIGGGLMRDMLTGRPTLLMSRELYAIPIMLGCIFYVLVLSFSPAYDKPAAICCIVFIFGLRSAAIIWKLEVPNWLTSEKRSQA
jgi:uncharacterized membrane protein YeiH